MATARRSPNDQSDGSAGAWSLALNVAGKTESLALVVGGSLGGGLRGIGVVSTAMAASFLGAAVADLGLAGELGRLLLAHPTRASMRSAARTARLQVPLAGILAPALFYLVLGSRTNAGLGLLALIAGQSLALLVNTIATTMFNSLAEFRTPAVWLGSARTIASIGAVAGAAALHSPLAILGSFFVGEAVCAAVLIPVLGCRTGRALPEGEAVKSRVRRAHLWLGTTSVINVLTNQSDTLLVATILSPRDLGLFSVASLLQNGVGTTALAAATPAALSVVRACHAGASSARLLLRPVAIGGLVALGVAVAAWLGAQGGAQLLARLHPLAGAQGQAVLALSLTSALLSGPAGVLLVVGIGLGLYRWIGIAGAAAGAAAIVFIASGAGLFGVIGAAAGTVARDAVLLLMAAQMLRNRRLRGDSTARNTNVPQPVL